MSASRSNPAAGFGGGCFAERRGRTGCRRRRGRRGRAGRSCRPGRVERRRSGRCGHRRLRRRSSRCPCRPRRTWSRGPRPCSGDVPRTMSFSSLAHHLQAPPDARVRGDAGGQGSWRPGAAWPAAAMMPSAGPRLTRSVQISSNSPPCLGCSNTPGTRRPDHDRVQPERGLVGQVGGDLVLGADVAGQAADDLRVRRRSSSRNARRSSRRRSMSSSSSPAR